MHLNRCYNEGVTEPSTLFFKNSETNKLVSSFTRISKEAENMCNIQVHYNRKTINKEINSQLHTCIYF